MRIVHPNREWPSDLNDPDPRRNHQGARQSTPMRAPWGDIASRLTEITDATLFGDVWQRPGLSPRDRSLITVASLIALYRTNELPIHLRKAMQNGVSRDEL